MASRKHWRRDRAARSWTDMVSEPGVRERVTKEAPEALVLLDWLASQITPFSDKGWSAFTDWTFRCYFQHGRDRTKPAAIDRVPESVPKLLQETLWRVVFPSSR